jgi:hypothetical protein
LRPASAVSAPHILPPPTLAPLPVFVRIPADRVALTNPSSSDNAREGLAIRPAIDLPKEPERGGVPSSIPSQRPTGASYPDDSHAPASVAGKANQPKNLSQMPPTQNQATEAIRWPANLPSATASLTPPWLTDVATPTSQGVGGPMVAADGRPSLVSAMLAPPSPDLTLQAWSYRAPIASGPDLNASQSQPAPLPGAARIPLPVSRSTALARPQSGLAQRTNAGSATPPQTTGSIPRSKPRPAMLAPAPNRNLAKPITNAASKPSLTIMKPEPPDVSPPKP